MCLALAFAADSGSKFLAFGIAPGDFPDFSARILVEGAMICLICPTATAAAVVTRKLGGDAAHLTTYTILVNLLAAILVPLVLPLVHPHPELNFGSSFALILGKVFPLLLCPFLAAILLADFASEVHAKLGQYHELFFLSVGCGV